MPEDFDLMEYSSVFTKKAWSERQEMSESHKVVIHDIINDLTENPDRYPGRTFEMLDTVFVYAHPDPKLEITYKLDKENNRLIILHLVAPKLEGGKPLFISYSHKDEKWLKELKKFLLPLEQGNLISIWDDSAIKPGDIWRNEIKKALHEAKLAILLVSQDFLNSDFISNNELPQLLDAAEQDGVKILWIAVRPCTVDDSEINKYQAVHKDPPLDMLEPAHCEAKLLEIYKQIKEVVKN